MIQAFRQIWGLVRPHKNQVFLAFLFGFLIALMSPVLPAIVQLLLKGLEGKGVVLVDDQNWVGRFLIQNFGPWIKDWSPGDLSSKALVQICALAIPVFYFLYGGLKYIHFYLIKYVSEKIVSDVRIQLMDSFLHQDVMFVNRRASGSGGLLSRTLNDTLVLQMGLQYYADLIREPFVALFVIGFMFVLSWKMTVACLVFLPIFLFVIRYVSKSLRKFGHQSQESLEEVTKTLKEGMDGVKVIQSFNLQQTLFKKFQTQVYDYLNKRRKIIKREEIGSPLNEWFASLLISGICLFQASLIWRGESDSATFVAFLAAAGLLDKPVKKIQQSFIRIQQNIVALERIQEVLNSRSEVSEPEAPRDFPETWKEIVFKDVTFSYGAKTVVSNLSLTIQKGEVIALVGESGSGKSTLVSLLLRFFDPQKGDILIDGTPIREFRIRDLRHAIGYVTQDVFLFDDSIKNNVQFGNLLKDPSLVEQALEHANAMAFINEKPDGMGSRVGERGNQLSGGEKQRVSIARAMFKDAPILILDEATSALDSASEIEVQKGLQQLLEGRTAFVIAHRLSTIVNSDRIIVMKNGEIVEQGTHQTLMDLDGAYSNYHNLQYGNPQPSPTKEKS